MYGAMYNYPAGVSDSDFDDTGHYYDIYREDMRERKADGMPQIPFDQWLEEYLDEVEGDEDE